MAGRLLTPHKLQRYLRSLLCVVSTAGVFAAAAFFPLGAAADPKPSDFGAETVMPLEAKPLPVEEVEEQLIEYQTPSSLEQKEENTPGSSDNHPLDESAKLLADKTTVLNVTDGDLTALIKTFSKLTKRNYIVDSAVKGKVTIHFPQEVTVGEALRIFESVLLLKGFTTVPVDDNVWKVIAAKEARQTTIPLVKDTPKKPSDALVTELVRLKYVPADEIQQLINQFVSRDGLITAVASTNSLVIIDSSANIKRLKELIGQLDVPALDQEISIIPILYAEAKDIADKINDILDNKDNKESKPTTPQSPFTQRPPTPGSVQSATRAVAASESGSRRALPLKIIPDERTNSIIVVADPEMTLKVRALAEQLDSKVDLSGAGFWVYRLKHADAEQIAQIIDGLISGAGVTTSGDAGKTQGSSISRTQSRERDRDSDRSIMGDRRDNQSRLTSALQRSRELLASRQTATGTGQAGVTGGGKVNLEGEVSIAADGATNSLIINAARGDYEKIKQVIEVLDIKRRQVIVEATLLEVSLNQEEGMGIELQGTAAWDDGAIFAQTNYDNLTNLLTRPNALSDLTIAAASSGTITLPGGIVIPSQAILVTALSKHQNVNVLSAPTILATDNEEAEIIVGENVPFVSSTSTNQTNLNNTFNQIDRQDVGITLRITPQIGTGDYVGLHMFVEISNVVPTTRNDPNGPTTTIRTSETQVEVKDGQMIVTGGLLQDRVSDSVRGVPFFKDIPVIGQWFQRQDNLTNRTNLLVFITPRVVVDQYDARDATKEYASGLSGYIEENEVQPDRRAVLESRSMDKVVEEAPVAQDRRLPTTVTPPRIKETLSEEEQEASERTMARLKALEKSKAAYPSSPEAAVRSPAKDTDSLTADDIIDVTVSPQLPQTNTNSSEEASPPSPALPDAPPAPGPFSAVPDALPTMEAKTATLKKAFSEKSPLRTFVVLRQTKSPSGNKGEAPFTYADADKTVGIVVLGHISSPAAKFFHVGERIRFASENASYEFVCLGVYAAPDEAAVLHPGLRDSAAWHILSPEQTMLLGKKHWLKG